MIAAPEETTSTVRSDVTVGCVAAAYIDADFVVVRPSIAEKDAEPCDAVAPGRVGFVVPDAAPRFDAACEAMLATSTYPDGAVTDRRQFCTLLNVPVNGADDVVPYRGRLTYGVSM